MPKTLKKKAETKRVVFYLLPETHRESKAKASLQGISMSDFAEQALQDHIHRRNAKGQGEGSPDNN